MSFSGSVKEELLRYEDSARHCCIAELAAMIAFHGEIVPAPEGKLILTISSENESIRCHGSSVCAEHLYCL